MYSEDIKWKIGQQQIQELKKTEKSISKAFFADKTFNPTPLEEFCIDYIFDYDKVCDENILDIEQCFSDEKAKAQMLVEASSAVAAPTRLDHYADKSNDLSRCNKALSASDVEIIQQSISKYQEQNDSNDESNESTHTRKKP